MGVLPSLNDFAARPARGFGDGEEFSIGSRRMKWLYTPHVPHGRDCGVLFDLSTKTLLCGDLFPQAGASMRPVTESEILTASEGMRGMMDEYAHGSSTPAILACEHWSAYRRDGGALLRELAATLDNGNVLSAAELSHQGESGDKRYRMHNFAYEKDQPGRSSGSAFVSNEVTRFCFIPKGI